MSKLSAERAELRDFFVWRSYAMCLGGHALDIDIPVRVGEHCICLAAPLQGRSPNRGRLR
jgi:hypothetical protein